MTQKSTIENILLVLKQYKGFDSWWDDIEDQDKDIKSELLSVVISRIY